MSQFTCKKIKETISCMSLTTENEIKDALRIVYDMIHTYELELYANDDYTEEKANEIREWRRTIARKVGVAKTKLETTANLETEVKRNDQKDLEETVRMVSKEVLKTNKNIVLLERSTLKLKGLNYTSKDLEKEIEQTKKMMQKDKMQEKKEIYYIKAALAVFVSVCILILLDKFGIKRFV